CVCTDLHPQNRAVLATRAAAVGLTLVDVGPGDVAAIAAANPFAIVLQYPGTTGAIRDLHEEITAAHEVGALAVVCADLLSLALLAVMAGLYAVWHGPEGLKRIARRVNLQARLIAAAGSRAGLKLRHDAFFDTVAFDTPDADALLARAVQAGFNLRRIEGGVA